MYRKSFDIYFKLTQYFTIFFHVMFKASIKSIDPKSCPDIVMSTNVLSASNVSGRLSGLARSLPPSCCKGRDKAYIASALLCEGF